MPKKTNIRFISLPISKSIANRLLLVKALRGDDLASFSIDNTTPDDVKLLYDILSRDIELLGQARYVNCQNCGTAIRFLTAYYAQKQGCKVLIYGDERMQERPIGQEVEALRQVGAEIRYVLKEGYPPLLILGRKLNKQSVEISNPESSQFVSALRLIGINVQTDMYSPYIDMTEAVIDGKVEDKNIEKDWSSAAFWYEYIALHGGDIVLQGLTSKSIQGDRVVADIFKQLGVKTTMINKGVFIEKVAEPTQVLEQDFSCCPDLYPAVYATCVRLGVKMNFSGLQSLPLKECNRLQAMAQLLENRDIYASCGDHRIAMALIVAGCKVDNTDCISKSYPTFIEQWSALLK